MRFKQPPTIKQQAAFNESVKNEKATSTRVVVLLGVALLILHSFMDYFGLPKEALYINYPIRGLTLLLFAAVYAHTYKPSFTENYNKIMMFTYFCCGITVCIGIFISKPGEYIYDAYVVGIIIMITTAFILTYLPLKHAISISVVFSLAYVMIKVFAHQDVEGGRFLTLISHTLFLMSAGVTSSIAQHRRDNLIYKNLKLQENLKSVAVSKTKEAKKQAKLANMDELTGIPNRRYITDCLGKAIKEAEKSDTQLTLLFIDLNGFKQINDTYGHDSGDRVLEITALRLAQAIRNEDYVARLGGDEFLIAYKTNQFSAKSVKQACDKLRTSVASPIAFNGHLLKVGTSIGLASYPQDGKNLEALMKVADRRMYEDKQESKSTHTTAIQHKSVFTV